MSWVCRYFDRAAAEASRWLQGGRTLWIWLALGIAILTFFYAVSGSLSDRARWAGTAFELLGVGAVVLGIDRARRGFGRPSLFKGMWIWLADIRFIVLPRSPVVLSAVGIATGSAMVTGAGLISAMPGTIDARVARLEQDMREVRESVSSIDRKVDQQRNDLETQLKIEIAARQAEDDRVRKQLEEGMIGDSPLELAGVGYLIFGLVLANLSGEIANGLQWLGLS